MSIALSQVLQRVFVRDSLSGEITWLPERVHAVLRVIFDTVLDDAPELPVRIFVEEIGRRCRKNVRTVQTALKEAERLGIIKRIRASVGRRWHGNAPEREIGATWPILVHWAVIEASKDSRPFRGSLDGKLVPVNYPQPWEKPEDFGGATFAGANSAGKKGTGKDHYPPEPGATVEQNSGASARPGRSKRPGGRINEVPVSAPVIPAGARARGGSETRNSIEDKSMNDDIERSQEARTKSLAALQAFGQPKAVTQVASFETDGRYWSWLTASAAVAGWVEKREGDWAGAASGDLEFVLQRRGQKSGQRAGTFEEQRASLTKAAACCAAMLARVVRWQKGGRIEVAFRPLGDHPLLLLDDLTPGHLELFAGWRGVAVLETSPGNLQASLMAPRCLRGDEILAAQRSLARRCGLTLAAVQKNQLRRVPAGVNNKLSLPAPFITRLFCEPVRGTVSVEQLAELLAEDAAHTAIAVMVAGTAVKPAQKPTPAATNSTSKAGRLGGGTDDSGSGQDWEWLMLQMSRVGGRERDRLVADLETRAGARERQGKPAGDPDHLRYAALTVDRALAYQASKKTA